ncbi:YDL063C [Zygosaccharomyces parabailii]|nr:YDL063C [Zygosaccharomyces parabailii]CDH10945.1 uncharacterized protein ZBAI_02731 [Zygosaccharomyces bailii ISA1307]
MGKSKKRSRASGARLNPLRGRNGVNNGLARKLDPLLSQLSSVVPNERAMALASISVMCEDPEARSHFLKEKLIHTVLSKLLNDENMDIVVESFGLLRNLSLEEGYDVSMNLWRSSIWLSIDQGFDKLLKSLGSLEGASTESRRLLFDYADNLLSLVVALANGSEAILDQMLVEEKLGRIFTVVDQLLQFGSTKLPLALFNTILDLLYDLSSESIEFIEAVNRDHYLAQFVQSLPQISNDGNELTKVLIQGVHLQFSDMNMTYDKANLIIHSICQSIQGINLQEIFKELMPRDEDIMNSANDQVAQKIKDYTKARNTALMKLQSIEIAIDLLTAIIEIVASLHEETGGPVPENLLQTLTEFVPVVFMSLVQNFTSRILISWNNLLWLFITLEINLLQLPNQLDKYLWNFVNSLDSQEVTILLGKWSVVWALLKTVALQPDPASWLLSINLQNNMQFAQSIIENYKNNEDAELAQKYIGVMAAYASFPGQIEVNRLIGHFILDQLVSQGTPPILLVEFTNSLFEMYADASYDYDLPVYVDGGFQAVISTQVAPNLKRCFKMVDRNKDALLKERCTECFNTLNSFIHYKQSERS